MADLRESFPGLEDIDSGNVGVAKSQAVEGDTITGRNFDGSLVAKRVSDDTLRFLQLDDAGTLAVTFDGAGTCLREGTDGTPVGGATSKTQVAEITLTAGKTYRKLEWSVCNFRDTIYTIEVIDDPGGIPTIQEVHEVIVGPGSFTSSGKLECFEFDTTGYTSPVLRLYGENLNNASDFRGTIAITEDAA